MKPLAKITIAAALFSIPLGAIAAPGSGVSAQALAELRAEVDETATALENERAAARDELAVLRAERAELERQVRAETTRAATLKRMRAEATTRSEERTEEARRWREPTMAAIAIAREHVHRTLPFAKTQRLEVLERIERDLSGARPDYARAVERLLRFIEEEEAMGREIALAQQRIDLEGEPQIVDVIRLGMALLYVRTQDGRYGWAVQGAQGWRIELFEEPALLDVVRARFAAHEANDALGPATILLPHMAAGASEAGMP